MVGSIQYLAEAIREDILDVLPNQRKTQRDKLSLLIATMLHVRSANTMDLAASLPIATQRIDMRYQWISRFLGNELVDINEIIDPFACFVLRQLSLVQSFLILTIDQTKASSELEVLGFGLEDTHLHYPNRLEKLILVMAIAMIWAVFSGLWDAIIHPLPYETKESALKKPIAA